MGTSKADMTDICHMGYDERFYRDVFKVIYE